jgi:hypothetical protein
MTRFFDEMNVIFVLFILVVINEIKKILFGILIISWNQIIVSLKKRVYSTLGRKVEMAFLVKAEVFERFPQRQKLGKRLILADDIIPPE